MINILLKRKMLSDKLICESQFVDVSPYTFLYEYPLIRILKDGNEIGRSDATSYLQIKDVGYFIFKRNINGSVRQYVFCKGEDVIYEMDGYSEKYDNGWVYQDAVISDVVTREDVVIRHNKWSILGPLKMALVVNESKNLDTAMVFLGFIWLKKALTAHDF
jgi:hypothetical protein